MNRFVRIAKSLAGPAMIVTVLFAGWTFRRQLFPQQETAAASEDKPSAETAEKQTVLEISEQARKNLSLITAAPQESDPEGKSSRFVGNHEKLGVVQEYAGTIVGVIDEAPYSGDFKEESHGEHDH